MQISIDELRALPSALQACYAPFVKVDKVVSITIPVKAHQNGKLYRRFRIGEGSLPDYLLIEKLGVYNLGKVMLWVVKE